MMHVALDARFLTHPQAGGFRTYTREVCAALVRVGTDCRFTLYVDRKPAHAADVPGGPNVRVRVVDGTRPFVGMPVREQFGLLRAVQRDRPDVFHSLCNTAPVFVPCPLVVTIHDTLWDAPFADGPSSRRVLHGYTRWAARHAARTAAAVCVPSQYVWRCVTRELGVDPVRVFVTPEAAGAAFTPVAPPVSPQHEQRAAHLLARLAAEGSKPTTKYALALGSADPRKNLHTVARVWANLPDSVKQTHALVTVWADAEAGGRFRALCGQLGIDGGGGVLPAVPDAALANLYRDADVFLFPSRAEGFGLPVLEAFACGCPVISSKSTSLPEVCGDAALLVDPDDAGGWAAALLSALRDTALQDDLRVRGQRRAALFSWDECARRTLLAYTFAAGPARQG